MSAQPDDRTTARATRHTLTVRLDADLYHSLLALCRVRGVSVNAAVSAAVEQAVCDVSAEEEDRAGEILGAWGVSQKRSTIEREE